MPDLAEDILTHLAVALRQAFDPKSHNPPRGGGTTQVRLFAGDSIPIEAWDAHSDTCGCGEPFIWVRVVQRYRTAVFPNPSISGRGGTSGCNLFRALEVEVGVGRCAPLGEEVDFEAYSQAAFTSLDDSRRIDAAMCKAMGCAVDADDATKTAIGPVVPWGPNGGVIANIGTCWVQLP